MKALGCIAIVAFSIFFYWALLTWLPYPWGIIVIIFLMGFGAVARR